MSEQSKCFARHREASIRPFQSSLLPMLILSQQEFTDLLPNNINMVFGSSKISNEITVRKKRIRDYHEIGISNQLTNLFMRIKVKVKALFAD